MNARHWFLLALALCFTMLFNIWAYTEYRASQRHVTFRYQDGRVERWDRENWVERFFER